MLEYQVTLSNSPRWLNTVTSDETGLTSQLISTPWLSTKPMKGCTTPTGSTPPTLYDQQCGFFYVLQKSEQWKSFETGPTVFRPYPRRLECLTICRCHNEGSTFSSVFLRPLVLARSRFEPKTFRSADRCLSSWAKQAAVSPLPHSSDRFNSFIRILAEDVQAFVVNESQVG